MHVAIIAAATVCTVANLAALAFAALHYRRRPPIDRNPFDGDDL
jgi:hypothetical protein